MNLQKVVALGLSAVLMAGAAAGCAKGKQTSNVDGKINVSVGNWPDETKAEELKSMEALREQMMTEHPDVNIIPDTYMYDTEMVHLIEKTHTEVAETGFADVADSNRAFELAQEIDGLLPPWGKQSWRWRIVYLRAMLDARRYKIAQKEHEKIAVGDEHGRVSSDWKKLLAADAASRSGFAELIRIFHCRPIAEADALHLRVRPVLDPL